jgi:tRNA-Thr(GGU) m(6)t(6)A37 methyltransferase TsaA
MPHTSLTVTPIGLIHTPFPDRASAPRQPPASSGTPGTIELFPDGRYEHALEDLGTFRLIWVLFWFHLNDGWKAKVLPPRSTDRRGVFATRSPYRPNPIGMSVLRLERIRGLTLDVLDVDMIDGTPLLDIKPYLPYADAIPGADHGWLDGGGGVAGEGVPERPRDPRQVHDVRFSAAASVQLAFLRDRFGIDLSRRIEDVLALGPSPHPYRRIRQDGRAFQLAVREWRVRFHVDGSNVLVQCVQSGYRPSVLFSSEDPVLDPHRQYVEAFGVDGDRDPGG